MKLVLIGPDGSKVTVTCMSLKDSLIHALNNPGFWSKLPPGPIKVTITIIKAQWYVKCDDMAKRAMDIISSSLAISSKLVTTFCSSGSHKWCSCRRS
uniref:TUG-UBL1 domain-containing protein n=1 Tax=Panagrellus redivivus TaxID=6233 RepID=A0A7E4WAN3_PANRE